MLSYETAPRLSGLTPVRQAASARYLPLLCLGAIASLCVILRLIHLGSLSLWTDEIFSRYYYQLFGLKFLWTEGLRAEPTPPLYYILLAGWMRVFGTSEQAIRSLSVAASVLALPLLYLLGRELGTRSQALLGSLLFALSPFALYFAQEARAYALTLIPATAVLVAVARFLRDPRATAVLVGYAVAAILCLYTHATLLLLLAACNLAVLASIASSDRSDRVRAMSLWLLTNVIVGVAAFPYLREMLAASRFGGLDWIPPLSARSIAVALSALISGVATPPSLPGIEVTILFIGVLIASLWSSPPDRRAFIVLAIIPGLFLGLTILASLARPILLPRILCWMSAPLCLLIAGQLLSRSRLAIVLRGTTALTFALGLTFQIAFADGLKEPWREAFGNLNPQLQQADIVVISPRFNPLILRYYATGVHTVRVWDEHLPPTIMTFVAPKLGVSDISRAAIRQAIDAGKPVWIIANFTDQNFLATLFAETRKPDLYRQWKCRNLTCISAIAWHVSPPSQP
jgi:mannosyltransferase